MAQLIKKLKDRELERIDVTSRETRVGRDETNDVVIDNPGVSRHHASVLYDGKEFSVSDQGSQNGLFVNGQQTTSWPLREGDAIQVGKFELVFTLRGGVAHHELRGRDDIALARLRNPLQTLALSPEDIQRYMADAAAKGKPVAPAAAPAGTQRPAAGRPPAEAAIEEEASNPYKALSLVLAFLVVGLGAVAVWLVLR